MTSEVPGAASPIELRREPRASARKLITLLPWGEVGDLNDSRKVRLIDCSAHGLGFEDATPMRPGEQFATQLSLDDQVTMVLYTVRHCSKVEGGGFNIGAELYGFVGDAESDAGRVLSSLLLHGLS